MIQDKTTTTTMSSRKRPLSEISQPHASMTPSRYAPSTPHAIRALQERSSAKRSARSARSVNRNFRNGHAALDLIRPDGSARNILKQFAKITAPVTKKRISTPTHVEQNKENTNPDGEDDSFMARKPHLTFNIEDSIEEEDSEIPVAPTPSALLDEDSDEDDDMEQPTITFQNIETAREMRAMSEKIDRRKSRLSMLGAEEDDSEEDERDGDATIMTERGRRALSEEATGRLSRYSFGSIRMSEFGSELEIRRESNRQEKLAALGAEDDYVIHGQDDTTQLYGDDTMARMPHSPTGQLDDSVHFPGLGDDTFNLQVPDDQPTSQSVSAAHDSGQPATSLANIARLDSRNNEEYESNVDHELNDTSRKQTQLETAATRSQRSRGKRVKLTRHGIAVPSLPSSLVKRIATEVQVKQGKKKPKFGRDHLKALEQATEWFFEQVGEDLAAYSSHGRRRKRVDTDDALLLMKRQRVLRVDGDLEKLAADWLPQEILDDLELSEES